MFPETNKQKNYKKKQQKTKNKNKSEIQILFWHATLIAPKST